MRLFLSMGVGVDGAVKRVSKGNTEEYRFINQYLKIEIYDLMFYTKFINKEPIIQKWNKKI